MRYELSHDTLAKQVYEKASAELKARQKVVLLVKRGLDRYQSRKILLGKEDLAEIQPHLENIAFKSDEQHLIQQSLRAQALRRNRLLATTLLIILALSGLSAWALLERKKANQQSNTAKSNELAANALLQLKSNKQANRALSLAAASLDLDSTNLNGRRVWYEIIFQDPDAVYYPPFLSLPISEPVITAQFLPGTHQALAETKSKLIVFDSVAQVQQTFGIDNADLLAWYVSKNGQLLAAAFSNQEIHIWDLKNGNEIGSFSYGEGTVASLYFAPDDLQLLLGTTAGNIEIFNLDGSTVLRIPGGTASLDWTRLSPDGQYILARFNQTILRIWKTTGEEQATIDHFYYPVNTVSFARNSPTFITTSQNDTAEIWTFTGARVGVVANPGHDIIYSARYSQDGNTILTANADAKVRTYTTEGRLLQTFTGHNERVGYAEFGPNDWKVLSASTDGTIKVWNSNTGKLGVDLINQVDIPLRLASFSSDGKCILSLDELNQLRVWNLDQTAHYSVLPPQDSYVQSISVASANMAFSTVAIDSRAAIWSMTGELLADLDFGYSRTASTPEGDYVLFGTAEGQIQLYNASTLQLETTYNLHEGEITTITFSDDGRWLLSTALDGQSWLLAFDSPSAKLDTIALLAQQPEGISLGVFSPDQQWAVLADEAHRLQLYKLNFNNNSRGAKKIDTIPLHKDRINHVVFSPDGNFFASASEDQTAILYSTLDQSVRAILSHPTAVNDILFSPQSNFILTASDDGLIRVWNTSGELEKAITAHKFAIKDLELSADGTSLLSAGDDGQVILFQLDITKVNVLRVAGFKHNEVPIIKVVFSPSGSSFITQSIDGSQYIWPLSFAQLRRQTGQFFINLQ